MKKVYVLKNDGDGEIIGIFGRKKDAIRRIVTEISEYPNWKEAIKRINYEYSWATDRKIAFVKALNGEKYSMKDICPDTFDEVLDYTINEHILQ